MAVVCRLCGGEFKVITNSHLKQVHCMSCAEYKALYPADMLRWGNAISGAGKPAWNSGLTREQDSRIRVVINRKYPIQYCEICGSPCKTHINRFCSFKCRGEANRRGILVNSGMYSKGRLSERRGLTYEVLCGKEKAKAIRLKSGFSHRNKVGGRTKTGTRVDLGLYFRSTWEANFARILSYMGVKWEYESPRCCFKTDYGILVLDFYLPELDTYVEVKGRLWEKSKLKLKSLLSRVGSISLKVVDKDVYQKLSERYGTLLPCWEV